MSNKPRKLNKSGTKLSTVLRGDGNISTGQSKTLPLKEHRPTTILVAMKARGMITISNLEHTKRDPAMVSRATEDTMVAIPMITPEIDILGEMDRLVALEEDPPEVTLTEEDTLEEAVGDHLEADPRAADPLEEVQEALHHTGMIFTPLVEEEEDP